MDERGTRIEKLEDIPERGIYLFTGVMTSYPFARMIRGPGQIYIRYYRTEYEAIHDEDWDPKSEIQSPLLSTAWYTMNLVGVSFDGLGNSPINNWNLLVDLTKGGIDC